MKTLTLDIETSPNLAHVWGLWQQNVGLPQLLESGEVLCVGAKWADEKRPRFWRGETMLADVHAALDEADVVVHFNGTQFDIPWLQSEFVRASMLPPSPFTQIDLCRVVKGKFRFPSNKLAYVAAELVGDYKASPGGHQTWIKCMAGDEKAWALMRKYCLQDVLLTERLFERLKPWINLPNPALYGDAMPGEDKTCPGCGSDNISRRGLAHTKLSSYQRYVCNDCGRWGRGKNRIHRVDVR